MAEAKLNREYAYHMLGVGMMMFVICLWSLYDGMRGWPQVNANMDKTRPLLLATNLTATAWLASEDDGVSALDRLFGETGCKVPSRLVKKVSEIDKLLPERLAHDTESLAKQAIRLKELFESPIYSEHDLESQWVQAGITTLLGLWLFLIVGLKAFKRFVADDRGLSGNGFGRQTLAYEDIAEINWTKWDEKGIITLTFKSGRAVKLDGWHFAGMTGIADEICKHRPDLALKPSDGNQQEQSN